MVTMAVILLWLILLVLYWPAAVLALVLVPVLWVVALPFRCVFWVVEAVLKLVRSILYLPARLLGDRTATEQPGA
jgi:hypothetical protein